MRTLKIRFVENYERSENSDKLKVKNYNIQIKRWFGWSTLGYYQGSCAGSFWSPYYEESKEDLLKEIIADKLETTKDFVKVIEYPSIKKY